jgi:peptidoglycan/LPS O-acetylase OafA/YrhL
MITHTGLFSYFGQLGAIGVDIFFALSGYLIGNQIFSKIAKHEPFFIKNFYLNRMVRILPNYCFVLALYFIFPFIGEYPMKTPFWEFATFTQNLLPIELPAAFSHAWSLCIEEHFYLILPLLALLFIKKPSLRGAWTLIGIILIGEIIIRTVIWAYILRDAGSDLPYLNRNWVYAPTFTRLDGLTLGVAIALLKNFHPASWDKLTNHGRLSFIVGIVGIACVIYMHYIMPLNDYSITVFSYTMLAFSAAALTLSALSKQSPLNAICIPWVTPLAIISYAMYLIHKILIHAVVVTLGAFNLDVSAFILLTLSIVATLAGTWLLYRCVERPFHSLLS